MIGQTQQFIAGAQKTFLQHIIRIKRGYLIEAIIHELLGFGEGPLGGFGGFSVDLFADSAATPSVFDCQ